MHSGSMKPAISLPSRRRARPLAGTLCLRRLSKGKQGLFMHGRLSMYRPKVMIADDHALLHDALKKFLEDDCDVVACVRDGLALVNAVLCLKPDVVLLDIALPLLNGLDAMTCRRCACDQGSTSIREDHWIIRVRRRLSCTRDGASWGGWDVQKVRGY